LAGKDTLAYAFLAADERKSITAPPDTIANPRSSKCLNLMFLLSNMLHLSDRLYRALSSASNYKAKE